MELEGEPAGNCGSGLSHVAADHPGITCGADRMLTIDCPEFRVEFEAVDDPDGIIDPDVLGAQVSMAVHDITAAGARREQLLFRHKELALSAVDPAYEPQRKC